jgi:hypothetical protein
LQGRAISIKTLPRESLGADDFRRMSARKLVYRSMVFAPAIFLVGLGVHARSLSDNFNFVANDPGRERAVLAYVPYLKKSDGFVDWTQNQSFEEARRVAKIWIEGAEQGKLKPLTPVAFEDTSSEGAKSEIFQVSSRIVTRLLQGVTRSIAAKNYHEATEDVVLAVRLANVLKHSDFISLFNNATAQRRGIQEIVEVADHLTAEDREKISELLPITQTKTELISKMLKRSRQLFVSWRERRGYQPLSIEDTQLLADVPALVENGNAVAQQRLRNRMFASQDDYVPTYFSSIRIGVNAQELLHKEIRSAFRRVNSRRDSR